MNHRLPKTLNAFVPVLGLAFASACSDDAGESRSGSTIDVQISGEELATDGFLFPDGSEVTIVDGWELKFAHVLVTVGNVSLSENPDRSPSDQSQTGRVVAEVEGPWVIDIHKEGSAPGAGGEGTAVPLFTFENQNRNGNRSFDPTLRYAFGYDILPATRDATPVNFDGDADAEAAYEEMIEEGYSVYYVGTATFRGTDCETSDAEYDFEQLPKTVAFRLGFTTPSTFINCQNEENEGDAFDGEAFQRGIPIFSNRPSVAQITLHLDHPFYSDVEHEPALYFDQFAAQLVGKAPSSVLTMQDVLDTDPTGFRDGSGTALPWRVCDGSNLPGEKQRAFEVGSVPFDPSADPLDALRDYRDYVHYVQSTTGHLNGGEGLCFVQRNYPSPP